MVLKGKGERKFSRKRCWITVLDRIRNHLIWEVVVVMRDLAGRVEKCGHVERMDSRRMAKRIYD